MGGSHGVRCRSLHLTWLAAGLSVVCGAGAWAQVATPSAPAAQLAADAPSAVEKALLAEADATVKAFNAADAATLGGMFIEDGELVDEDGNVTEGRAAITALFKGFFERFPKAILEMELTDAREICDEMVVEEGVRRITADEAAAAAQVLYVAVRVKQGDRWPLAAYREFSDDPLPTPTEMLAPLDWIVGEWID